MDSTAKLSPLPRRGPGTVDVSCLDKINAFPSKNTDDALLADLGIDDLRYINAMMDQDSSESDNEEAGLPRSAWSPMVQSPVMMNKGIRKLRPNYAITLSLEDISYIRPSWGLSKGIRTIELGPRKKKVLTSERTKESKKRVNSTEKAYRYFLILLGVIVLLLTVPAYLHDKSKEYSKLESNRFKIDPKTNTMEIYKPLVNALDIVLKVQFAQDIPLNLKPDKCSCDIYTAESKLYNPNVTMEDKKSCLACFDWAFRSNLRVYMSQKSEHSPYCYDIKWQSYDSLATPITNCFILEDEHWFGLGDIQDPLMPLNKLQFESTPLVSNLSSDFQLQKSQTETSTYQVEFGSFVETSLLSTKGVQIGNVKTDFEVSLKMTQDLKLDAKKICLSVACTDRCTQSWSRRDHLEEFRYKNNILEYRICTSNNLSALLSRQFLDKAHLSKADIGKVLDQAVEMSKVDSSTSNETFRSAKFTEQEKEATKLNLQTVKEEVRGELPEGIGLIERTIFATSPEFMPILDGQALRQHVDNIVKLGLKTSSILLVDTRWETYAGSLKLNTAAFPKSKLLFEILHNKGFKILFTIKPYIDSGIGINNINKLFEAGRLYAANYQSERQSEQFLVSNKSIPVGKETVIRRESLFSFKNQTIKIGTDESGKIPYIFKCKESVENHCAIIDLTQSSNRAWLISGIMRSSLLTVEADGIQIGGTHPNSFIWDDHFRAGIKKLVNDLYLKEKRYVLPQYIGTHGYIQLAPRPCTWNGLKSILNSVLNLGMTGFSLIHPGSVWGDLKSPNHTSTEIGYRSPSYRISSIYGETQPNERSKEELLVRWLQVSMFLPILQFNDISSVEKYGLQEMIQNLTRIRKTSVVPELKKNLPFTPFVDLSKFNPSSNNHLPLIRPVLYNHENTQSMIPEQFTIGTDILVAPILSEGLRQRDIYLPGGFWRDELRHINLRGGKWLRNYPVEMNEIAWFSRTKR